MPRDSGPPDPSPPADTFAALFEQEQRASRNSGATQARRNPREGEVFDATVVQVGKDAVFVEMGGRRQGFIEATDLKGPDGALKVALGDRIRARVVGVDPEHGVRLAPTLEAAVAAGASVAIGPSGDPHAVTIAVGQVVAGAVERVETYGLFVQIDGTKGRSGRGLLPTAEIGAPRGADLRKMFPLGTKVKAKVLEIGEGKMRLSVRALADDEERSHFEGFREQGARDKASPQFGTLGDLKALKGLATKKT
jgi:small subunit ribosomal protein S1